MPLYGAETTGEKDVPLPMLTLSDAVGIALENNRLLGAAHFDNLAAAFAKTETQSAFWPHLSFQSTTSKMDSERFKFEMPDIPGLPMGDLFSSESLGLSGASYQNSIMVSQLLFDRSVIGQIKLVQLRKEAAGWQEVGQKQIAVYQTVTAYLDVLRAKELLDVQKQRLELADKQLKSAQSNFEAGLRIRTDVLRTQLSRSSALRDVVSAEIALQNAQVALNQAVGIPMGARHSFESGPLESYNPSSGMLNTLNDFDTMFSIAEANHPSVKIASYMVEQDEESIAIAQGEFLPRITVGGSFGYNESNELEFEKKEWAIQGQVEIPIFEGFRKIAKVKRARAEHEAEQKRYEDTVRSIHALVEQSTLALQEEHRNLEIALEAEIVATENHERFLNLFDEGLADSLDVTQALTELVEAQTSVVTTRYGYLRVYIQLRHSLGTIPVIEEAYTSLDLLSTLE